MGKRLIQQRRGRGTLTYKSPGFRFQGRAVLPAESGRVADIVHCAGHTAPLLEVVGAEGKITHAIAPEGIKVNDMVAVMPPPAGSGMPGSKAFAGGSAESTLSPGSVICLRDIPEGTPVHNLEIHPGDGGKLCRSSGTAARVVAKLGDTVIIKLPSKKEKTLSAECRAAIGVVAGSGRLEKPFLTAGARYKKMRARNKLYPKVCGISMNAVDHPFGGKGSHTKGRPTQASRNDPPGRKVGKIAPRRTGRRKM